MKVFIQRIVLMFMVVLAAPVAAKVTYGVRAGGAYSALIQKVNGEYNTGARFGFSVAGLADIPLYKKLSLRPELAFVNQGGSYYSSPVINTMGYLNKCSYYSIVVPINLAYTFLFTDVRFSVFAGPALDFSLFGKMKKKEIDANILFGQTEDKDLKPFDLGVNLGLGVEYSKFFFSIAAFCGTLDRRATKHEGESSVYQNNVTFSLGYYFR